ncbi:riboflavin synthase-like isoform X3 [Arachis stenosperma]|uniref:riboflavin synthase-like isoform X3 n=1 Tax=Arachis stenosperma TaxID=217475 RepID=UPI0025AB9611|nr:riboflavin synthase-like isoform X3 [Arachis stenosperma]
MATQMAAAAAVVPSSIVSTSTTPKIIPSTYTSLLLSKAHHRRRLAFNPILKPSPLRLTFLPNKPRSTLPFRRTNATAPQIRCLFTGIVEELGTVKQLGKAPHGGFDMVIEAKTVLEGVNLGDSIAVNGTCLTVTEFDANTFTVGLSPETLRKTSLEELQGGSLVNLERALTPTSRMGGHFVQGHVDGTGIILSKVPEGDSLWIKVKGKGREGVAEVCGAKRIYCSGRDEFDGGGCE